MTVATKPAPKTPPKPAKSKDKLDLLPGGWRALAKAALTARLRAERAALARLRAVLRAEHDALAVRLAQVPEDAPRQAGDAAVRLVSSRLRFMGAALEGAVHAARLDAKRASLGIFQREWAQVQKEVAAAGFDPPLGLSLTDVPLEGAEDRPRSAMAGQALATAWAHLVIASIYRWTASPEGSLVRAVAVAPAMDPRLRRTAATETGIAYQDLRDDVVEVTYDEEDGATWLPGLFKRWDATLDARTCAVCRALDGEITLWGLPFPGGEKPGMVHAHDRCVETTVFLPIRLPARETVPADELDDGDEAAA